MIKLPNTVILLFSILLVAYLLLMAMVAVVMEVKLAYY
jgi:hypothetical protein